MNRISLEKLDIDVYHETLPSGLNVYVAKKDNCSKIVASLFTNYGSENEEFIPRDETKMRKLPLGIAHFLEHQMFNMEDGSKPFEVFSDCGANCNAYTNFHITNYYFSGVNNKIENIRYLLHYVGSPYFTKESVQKEKGIIIEEAKMYENDVYSVMYEKMMANIYKVNPRKYPIIGTVKDIKKTTDKDLMTCYNTFYHPSNMTLVVAGNINPMEVIEEVKNSDFNKKHEKDRKYEIKLKEIKEPLEVAKEKEIIKFDVELPKTVIAYKININSFDDIERQKLSKYISIILNSKFSETSLFLEKLKEDEIIKYDVDLGKSLENNFCIINFMVETNMYEEFLKRVQIEMDNFMISEEEFDRKKKVAFSTYVDIADNVSSLSNYILYRIRDYNKIENDEYTKLKNLNYFEMKEMIKRLSFKNKTILIVEKEDKK